MTVRDGNAERRQLEFDTLVYQVRKNRERLIARLIGSVKATSTGCVLWTGAEGANGYGRVNFRMAGGKHVAMRTHVMALILQLGRPIARGHDAGHSCAHRLCIRHVSEQRWQDNLRQRDEDQRKITCRFCGRAVEEPCDTEDVAVNSCPYDDKSGAPGPDVPF